MDPGLATFLGAGVQSLSSGLGGLFTNGQIKKENQKNRDWNEKMWHLTNEYNSPKAQMQRYTEAGLNPNLVYGSAENSIASYAGNLGTSQNFKNPLEHFDTGLVAAAQLKMQKELVDSQVSLNASAESKNIADAEESYSKIGANLSNKHLIDSLTDKNKLDVAFNELTFETRNAIVNFDAALKEQSIELVRSQIKNLDAATNNNNRLTDMRITSMAESLKLAWSRFNLDSKLATGQLELWAKQGDAAILQGKAAFLNALTNSNAFNLEKEKFEKFSPKQLELLEQNVYKLKTFNGWYDPMLEMQLNMMQRQYNNAGKLGKHMDLQNTYFDMQMFMPLLDLGDISKFY